MIGRPSKYDPGIHTQLAYWMAKNGLIDEQIAKELSISKATLTNWKREHPELLASLKRGKEHVDVLVEGTLLKRALGFEYTETHRVPGEDKDELVIIREVTKHNPGDVTAQIFWLKNRKPNDWRDRKEISGIDGNPIKLEIEYV